MGKKNSAKGMEQREGQGIKDSPAYI